MSKGRGVVLLILARVPLSFSLWPLLIKVTLIATDKKLKKFELRNKSLAEKKRLNFDFWK